jgi:hypothetical protein
MVTKKKGDGLVVGMGKKEFKKLVRRGHKVPFGNNSVEPFAVLTDCVKSESAPWPSLI